MRRRITLDEQTKRWLHRRVDERWKRRAACRDEDPDLWFPEARDGSTRAASLIARAICLRCPVRAACLEFAIETDERYGIYGGLTSEERAEITGKKPYG